MHVGFAPVFMNTSGAMSDLDCFKHELALADLAEPLGFDSIWQPEHHFSGYEMTPNVLQFLTYMAGRTKTIRKTQITSVRLGINPLGPEKGPPTWPDSPTILPDRVAPGKSLVLGGRTLARIFASKRFAKRAKLLRKEKEMATSSNLAHRAKSAAGRLRQSMKMLAGEIKAVFEPVVDRDVVDNLNIAIDFLQGVVEHPEFSARSARLVSLLAGSTKHTTEDSGNITIPPLRKRVRPTAPTTLTKSKKRRDRRLRSSERRRQQSEQARAARPVVIAKRWFSRMAATSSRMRLLFGDRQSGFQGGRGTVVSRLRRGTSRFAPVSVSQRDSSVIPNWALLSGLDCPPDVRWHAVWDCLQNSPDASWVPRSVRNKYPEAEYLGIPDLLLRMKGRRKMPRPGATEGQWLTWMYELCDRISHSSKTDPSDPP
jgi:hypothetical protein